ncbi:MAG: hypothetical protein OXG33_03135 [Chloroflexi bacterium]|nr:hypothetical protein [Chloroflexota bacterium]
MINASARRAAWLGVSLPRPTFRGTAYGRKALGLRLLQLARRRQRARALALAPRLVTLGVVGTLLIAVPAAWLGGPDLLVPSGIALALAGAVVLAAVALHVPAPHDVALAYDNRAGLHERLSTAIAELRNVDSDVRELQHADALAAAGRLNPGGAMPYGVSRRDLLVMALAAAALATWAAAITFTPFWRTINPPLSLDRGDAEQSDAAAPAPAAPGDSAAALDPATAAEIERMQAAIDELRAQLDPEASTAAQALHEASEHLRLSDEGRQLGRELGNREYAAAASELRRLAAELSEMSAAQREELGERFGEAAAAAAADPRMAEPLGDLADALESGRLSDARSSFEELASMLEAVEESTAGNAAMQQELAALESALAEMLADSGAGAGLPGESAADGPGMPGQGGMAADGNAAMMNQSAGEGGGLGGSAAEGQEVPANIEGLAANQRLDAEGRLETVQIDPTAEGQETVMRPVLELGTDVSREYEPSAGNRGTAVGRPDMSRALPADRQILLDRYFSTP